jgi:hypothetical protein
MKRLAVVLIPFAVLAQEPADTLSPWKHTLVAGVTLTQVAFKDWAQGGEDALAWTLSVDGKSERTAPTTQWASSYKLAYGQTKLGIQPLRKTDDRIELESVLTYLVGTLINPYAAATLKTQFTTGYRYADDGTSTPVSTFFDPAYVTQSAGLGYQPLPELKTRLGVALREIFTSTYTGYSDNPATLEIEKTKVEGGLESVTDLSWKLEENVLLTSKLELFSPIKKLSEFTLRMDNTLAAKVSQYVTVNLNVQLLNDSRVTTRTQVKETLALGISLSLL